MKKHNNVPETPFMQFVKLLAFMLLAFTFCFLVITALSYLGVDTDSMGNMLWSQTLTQLLVFMLPALLFAKRQGEGLRTALKLRFRGSDWCRALVGVVLLVLLIPATDFLNQWNNGWHWHGSLADLEQQLRQSAAVTEQTLNRMLCTVSVPLFVINLVVFALVPAVCEEMLFRGTMQPLFQKMTHSPHAAILVTALVFSLFHGDLFALLPRFVMGAALGYLFYYSGSIVTNIAAHFANNAIIVIFQFLYARHAIGIDPSAPLQLASALTICCTLAALMLFYTQFMLRSKNETLYKSKKYK